MKDENNIAVGSIDPDSSQPRRHFDEGELMALGQSLRTLGQKLPIIAYRNGERFVLVDGERRWRAAAIVGLKALSAIVLPAKPSAAELHVLRMSIDVHKVAFSAIERSNLLVNIQAETKWSISELAEHLGMKQPLVSKLLAFQKLCPEVRDLLDRGEIDSEKAFAITQEPDAAKQIALSKESKLLSREQVRARLNNPKQNDVRTSSARFAMPGGVSVVVQAKELTLATCIEVLIETVKQLKKGQGSGHDISTLPRVMRNQCRQLPKSALKN